MDRFIARENIKHFRDMLLSDIDPSTRARVQRLLVEEEDKLGKNLELLADIENHIAQAERLIETQRSVVEALQRDGHNGIERAVALLDGMVESQQVSTDYHHRVANEVQPNRRLDC